MLRESGASSAAQFLALSIKSQEYGIIRLSRVTTAERDASMPADASHKSKQQLRRAALAARDALSSEQRVAAADAIAARGLPFALAQDAVVSGYSPIRSEVDPLPLMRKLADAGARLALPTVTARGHSLIFRAWSAGDRLLLGSLGILEPSPASAEVVPDIMLVPLAAFDRLGHRIGYGAGYYDYTFSHLRKMKAVAGVGLAFAVQEIEAVPALSHDVALDYVLTEREALDFRRS
jgi:5-formyltetrahydrofolate cyclo-ligase